MLAGGDPDHWAGALKRWTGRNIGPHGSISMWHAPIRHRGNPVY